jgi:type VI secretion system protein ImpC
MKKKRPISIEKLEFQVVGEEEEEEEETKGVAETDTPFRVAILSDFSGRANRGLFEIGPELAGRRLLRVDRDNLDDLPGKMGAQIHLPVGGKGSPPVVARFTEIESFHPDRLYGKVDAFRGLMNAQRNLAGPRSLPKAPIEGRSTEPKIPDFTSGSLLDEIIEETAPGPTEKQPSSDASDWNSFLKKIMDPYAIPAPAPDEADLISSVEAVTAKLMRGILHFPDFQALEAAWRGVAFLISRLETESGIEIYLLDVSKAELAADLGGTENVEATGLYQLLVKHSVEKFGPETWAVIAGNYVFDPAQEDGRLLERIGRIAEEIDAPFISSAGSHLLGCESLADTPDPDDWQQPEGGETGRAWQRLRKLPEAAYVGLALPRFLLRLPYGANTDSIESFPFEEMLSVPCHDDYLWCNPSFACVYLLAEAFSQDGWNLRPGAIQDIGSLPVHVYKKQGESVMTPCAEVFLSQRAAEGILDKGLMPLLSFRDRDAIRLARFQSIADPLTALPGRWG